MNDNLNDNFSLRQLAKSMMVDLICRIGNIDDDNLAETALIVNEVDIIVEMIVDAAIIGMEYHNE